MDRKTELRQFGSANAENRILILAVAATAGKPLSSLADELRKACEKSDIGEWLDVKMERHFNGADLAESIIRGGIFGASIDVSGYSTELRNEWDDLFNEIKKFPPDERGNIPEFFKAIFIGRLVWEADLIHGVVEDSCSLTRLIDGEQDELL